jgi:hypothetical protein
MQSIDDLTERLTGIVESTGIDLPDGTSSKKKIICFNDGNGNRVCEAKPSQDEIKCNGDGLCSVYISGIKESNDIEDIASNLGLRTFMNPSEGSVTKTITGIVKKDDLKSIADVLQMEIKPTDADRLRPVASGDIPPDDICKYNPLSKVCEPYVSDRTWHYMGPFVGWIKADSFREALKILKNGSSSDKNVQKSVSVKESGTNKKRILTTL